MHQEFTHNFKAEASTEYFLSAARLAHFISISVTLATLARAVSVSQGLQ